jgi:transglutaminase-like putative cysteine protease
VRQRGVVAVAILLAWLGGVGMLVRREYFRPHIDRLAEAALRVTPAAVFFAVMQGDRQVGFASSTVDTATATIEQRDYLVADIPSDGRIRRTETRTNVVLSRTLRVKTFEVVSDASEPRTRITGDVESDTLLRLTVTRGTSRPDTQLLRLSGPLLLPTLVPLAVALEDRPRVGKSYTLPLFDPASLQARDVRLDVRAESLFVLNDSSVFDSTASRWVGARPDTVRGWQIVPQSGSGMGGWVDEQGRLIASTQLGFILERRPYEVAFENWQGVARAAGTVAPGSAGSALATRDFTEMTAIAAGKRPVATPSELRVRLRGARQPGFSLDGGRQQLLGDTLVVRRETSREMAARYVPILNAANRARTPDLRAERFLEVDHREIQELADRLADRSRDPRRVVQRISQWVHDSVRKESTVGIPSALHVLHTRRGDANEHTQLFVALARAAGVRARVATGLIHVDGKFYYHAWPEVLLHTWVAVDPTFGQFPADAAHIRFATGPLGEQTELIRAMAAMNIDVIRSR